MVCTLQVNRRQAQADVVACEYAELQQAHSNLQNELLEAQHQVQLMQAEVRQPDGRLWPGRVHGISCMATSSTSRSVPVTHGSLAQSAWAKHT